MPRQILSHPINSVCVSLDLSDELEAVQQVIQTLPAKLSSD